VVRAVHFRAQRAGLIVDSSVQIFFPIGLERELVARQLRCSMRSLRLSFLVGPLVFGLGLCAQHDLVLQSDSDGGALQVRALNGASEGAFPVFQGTWRFAGDAQPSFGHQRLSIAEGQGPLMLDQLVLAGLDRYLDMHVHFEKQGVKTDMSVERLMATLDGMVRAACEDLGVREGFMGFSEATEDQMDRIASIDWSQAKFGVDGGDDQDKYLAIYYYVRTQRQELERQMRADLLPLASVDLLAAPATAGDPGHTLQVPTVCRTVFDDDNYLCALNLAVEDTLLGTGDLQLTDEVLSGLAEKARKEAKAEASAQVPGKVRKRDRWLKEELDKINARIDQLDQRKELWALRDRMDDIEGRIDDLGTQVNELKEGGARPSDNPIANLSALTGKDLVVRFAKGSVNVAPEYLVVLNEVFEQLARSPKDRVLITGYTDKGGDPAANLALSEQRARSVRAYLIARGIAEDRLLVNYYGSSRSSGIDPGERRAEIEWLR
jgi:outer membrane protein OmpA-like peptidoglycan-associated protein